MDATGNAGLDGDGNRYAYLSRFTASTDVVNGHSYLTAVPDSEVVLLGGAGQSLADISGIGAIDSTIDFSLPASDVDPATGDFIEDYIKVDSASHAGGGLAFGPDGNLYVSIGDGVSFNAADPRVVSVQSVDALAGKILRIDPITGEGLSDNPFYDGGALTANSSKVYQLGLRNPFRIAFDETGRLFVSETGWNTYEEINSGSAGANFGWPYYEGSDGGSSEANVQYSGLLPSEFAAFNAAVGAGTVDLVAPFRAFHHIEAEPGLQINAIVGGTGFVDGPNYPATLHNNYIFTDFNDGEIFSVDINNDQTLNYLFDQPNSGFGPVQFITGPDGYIYTVDLIVTTGSFEIADNDEVDPGTVIFRWNAGNTTVASIDEGPDWGADSSIVVGGPSRVAGGTITGLDASVPTASTPTALYGQRRWDPLGGEEMGLEIGGGTLAAGTYAVRLFLGSTA